MVACPSKRDFGSRFTEMSLFSSRNYVRAIKVSNYFDPFFSSNRISISLG